MSYADMLPPSELDDTLISRIKEYIRCQLPPKLAADAMLSIKELRQLGYTPRVLFPTVSSHDITRAEAEIGFSLPNLLKRMFLEISNGIAGFGYDIMGLEGGCDSHCGTLIETYTSFKSDYESEDKTWKIGLLPFCHWGCNIFSCVDCTQSRNPIFTYEDSCVSAENYFLSDFFEMWLNGRVLFSQENVEIETKEISNPFTNQKTAISS